MLTDTELAKVLIQWRKSSAYAAEKNGHFVVPTNRSDRMNMYRDLIATLTEKYNYTEDELGGKTERMVVEASMAPTSQNKDKWKLLCVRDWTEVIVDFFPKETINHDPSKMPEQIKHERLAPVEYASEDPRLAVDNPVDTTIFAGLPPVEREIDEEFAKLLKEAKGE
ncbi:MAG: hypothetical protein HC840_00975 [Leptolyngbyaceae cyanobacterium RM2_2_4]|nr:hypothetical protein [Leptolyngbyaceae cyanobacterium RM2_2_4]